MSGERKTNTGGGEYRETHLHDNSRSIETRDNSRYYENYNQPQHNVSEVAAKIEKLLDYFEQNDPSISQAQQIVKTATEEQPEILDAEIVEEAIRSSPTLRQRIEAAGTAAYVETIKLLLPPFSIAYEGYKAFKNP